MITNAINYKHTITKKSIVNKASTSVNGADGHGGCPGGNNNRGLIGAAGPGGLPPAPPSYVQYSDLQGTLNQ